MDLIINNRVITGDLQSILLKLRLDSHNPNLFRDMQVVGNNIRVTCPKHKDGLENHPSCNIFANHKDPKVEFGLTNCFTCGYTVRLPVLVRDCLNVDDSTAKQWLIDNFSDVFVEKLDLPEEINLKSNYNVIQKKKDLVLNYEYHPYLAKRHINEETAAKFGIYYEAESNCIVFPVWDIHNNLVMNTKRNVNFKQFYLEKNVQKPIYLLNFLMMEGQTTAYIAESQFNALTLQQWGYPGVAMLGGGCKEQYEILKKSGIRNYVLCFDGDMAGDADINRFIENMPMDVIISIKKMPRDGRDVNDLTKEEFDKLPVYYS